MFEQRERWLEELRAYTDEKDSVTSTSGRMPWDAIVREIDAACSDARPHGRQQIRDWQSRATDLTDSLDWTGPELLALVGIPARAVVGAITTGLLVTTAGKPTLDDTKRPAVGIRASVLLGALDSDALLVAAWRDLVAACRRPDHTRFPADRIAFLRDTLIGLIKYRNQDLHHTSPISTAVSVLHGGAGSVELAQEMVGDAVQAPTTNPHNRSRLTDQQLADLAERCIVLPPPTGNYIVWLRLSPGFIGDVACVTHGGITFYDAMDLARALLDHDMAREMLDVVPEELLTDEIRDLQASNSVDDYVGFEYDPELVYARVTITNVEHHRAVDAARTYLAAVLTVVGVHEGMWKILDGYLLYDGEPSYLPEARWGLKEPRPDPVFHQNDHFTADLEELNAKGKLITAEAAASLQPALRLFTALTQPPLSDPEATVMAAVRAIEHCNTWTAPGHGLHWSEYINQFLIDEYTVNAFARRVGYDGFAAVVAYRPDRSLGAVPPPELETVRKDITVPGWGTRIDIRKVVSHVTTLKRVYAQHWLVRRLAETEDTLSSGTALAAAFDAERYRVDCMVKRLTRSRNAAIHGGPLSDAACGTVARFAATLARQAVTAAIWATINGEQLDTYATHRRHEFQQRIQNLTQGGDVMNLFRLTP
ncbi:hypothetical protein [Mycolicibacterium sp. S3B2]|uniref:hypothetical protein n=1 Tax=Mycolicibacterium sp. S3B2 TaxID=3415120 RepID=UPI003C7CCA11